MVRAAVLPVSLVMLTRADADVDGSLLTAMTVLPTAPQVRAGVSAWLSMFLDAVEMVAGRRSMRPFRARIVSLG